MVSALQVIFFLPVFISHDEGAGFYCNSTIYDGFSVFFCLYISFSSLGIWGPLSDAIWPAKAGRVRLYIW